jgi:glycogen debranching enzyme
VPGRSTLPEESERPRLVRIRARPQSVYISRNRSVFATGRDGFITGDADHGFFVHQTRLLSRYGYRINDAAPTPNVLSTVDHHSWLGYYLAESPASEAEEPDSGSGQVPALSRRPLELKVSRFVDDGLHEDLDLTNYGTEAARFVFALDIDADFADLAEREERQQKGTLERSWDGAHSRLTFAYSATHAYDNQSERGSASIHRSVTIDVRRASTPARFEHDRLSFSITLQPHESWHACIVLTPTIDGTVLNATDDCPRFGKVQSEHDQKIVEARRESTQIRAPGSETLTAVVLGAIDQARADLAALRLFDLDVPPRSWTVAAGLPLYSALFGRDTLTAGWQAALLSPDLMHGALKSIADLQGTEMNDWRDEQPGKMLHEAHSGPLATLNYNPRKRSYSSITTSGLFAFMLAELWHWTGDKNLVRPLVEPALRAMQWLDRYGDLDGDGFYEYLTRSTMGPRNQAWKDSNDAIVYGDGRNVDAPIATCEEQGFIYVAKLHLSEVMWSLGEKAMARRLYESAGELKARFHDAFWMEEEGFYAMALDSKKRQVTSIGSNAGHCVAAAIVESSVVTRVVDRLFEPDLFSGWGIRTLSDQHPRYNPYSYHLGSIWPVEHGTFALGFMRYGLFDRAQQIAKAQFEAAALFDFYSLPELFGGQPRDDRHAFPGIYPNANSPQAWSASMVFSLLQAMLGLYPYAPLALLLVDPHLPEWLPEITLENLRIGKATVTIRFWRKKDGRSTYRVLEQRGKLHVVRQATPWSLTTSFAERLRDVLSSFVSGK